MFNHLPLLHLHGAIMKVYMHCLEHQTILTKNAFITPGLKSGCQPP